MESHVFVYGTLMSGHSNHILLKDAKFVQRDTIRGSLWAVSSFPAWVREGNTMVSGEIYQIKQHHLDHMDHLEGYNKDDIPSSMYIRSIVVPDKFDEFVFVYEWNMEYHKYPEITTGNYRTWNHSRNF